MSRNKQQFQNTDKKIMNIVNNLLQKKSIDKITVTEICQILKINRSTFYTHYLDVYDVLEKIEYEMTIELEKEFVNNLKYSTREAFISCFRFIKANKDFYIIYLRSGKEISFLNKILNDKIKNDKINEKIKLSESELNFHYMFFRAGISAIIQHWLKLDCNETEEYLFKILKDEYKMIEYFYE